MISEPNVAVTTGLRVSVHGLGRLVTLLLATVSVLSAQEQHKDGNEPQKNSSDFSRWQIGTYVAAGRNSPNDGVLGTIPRRDHFIVGLQAGTTVLRLGPLRLQYIAQLLPLAIITDASASAFNATLDSAFIARLPRRAVAFGLAPFGLELGSALDRRVSGYLSSAGGGLIFNKDFPDVTGRRTNFTLEAGAGVRVRVGRQRWAQIGYKYHHMSNAGTAFANPGLDGNLAYVGYQWSARLPR